MVMPKIAHHEDAIPKLVHSNAHEEDVPGTVNLIAIEGDDTAYGQALFPVPAQDPNDPLQWPRFKKLMILVVICMYSFLGNSALGGIGPYIVVYAAEFNITPTEASNLLTYPSLLYGFGSLILIPLYLKFGRRPVMLGTIIVFIAGLIGCSVATTFNGLMGARCVASLASGICEALPVQLVNDVFFLHERGKQISYYTAALCLAAIAPLCAGYMLQAGYSWRLFFYVNLAFTCLLFVLAFFFVEETSYDRDAMLAQEGVTTVTAPYSGKHSPPVHDELVSNGDQIHAPGSVYIRPRRRFAQTLSVKGRYDPSVPFFLTMARSFSYFLVPQALWVITTFGICIGLGSFAINLTFPTRIIQPPYNWDISQSGLLSVAAFLGFLLALPLASSSDRLAAYLTRRNGGIREAEMRLGVMLIPMFIGPAGLISYGFTAQYGLHWIGLFFGCGMTAWSGFFFFSYTIAYAVDSYFANTSEMLIAINIGKQAISFGFGYAVLDWVIQYGYVTVIAGIFTGVLVLNNLMLLVFMFWGKKIRRGMSKTWLARLHQQSNREVATH